MLIQFFSWKKILQQTPYLNLVPLRFSIAKGILFLAIADMIYNINYLHLIFACFIFSQSDGVRLTFLL